MTRTPVPDGDPRSPSPGRGAYVLRPVDCAADLIDRVNAIDWPTAVWISTVVGVWIPAMWWIFAPPVAARSLAADSRKTCAMMSRARPEPASRMPPDRLHSRLLLIGFVLLGVFVVGAGGAAPRYNRIGYGAVPLALALICFGGVAYSHRADGRRRVIALCCWLLAVAVLAIWFRPSLAGAVAPEPRIERSHVLLTLPRDRLRTELFAEIQPIELANCRLERFWRSQ